VRALHADAKKEGKNRQKGGKMERKMVPKPVRMELFLELDLSSFEACFSPLLGVRQNAGFLEHL
jgi:hypothetical protein